MGEYPTDENPINAFTDMLVTEMANQGVNCVVIAPQSRTEHFFEDQACSIGKGKDSTQWQQDNDIFSSLQLWSAKSILGYNTARLTQRSYERVVLKEYVKRNIKADVLYGQFFSLVVLLRQSWGTCSVYLLLWTTVKVLNSLDILNRKMVVEESKSLAS